MRYELIGDGSSSVYFDVNSVTGTIFIRQSLANVATDVFYVSTNSILKFNDVQNKKKIFLSDIIEFE